MAREEPDERRRAFEAVALPHAALLRAAARRLVRDASAADDLVQDALLRAYRGFAGFEPGTNAKAWLLTILYSASASAYRKSRVERESFSLEDLEARFERRMELSDPNAHLAIVEGLSRADDVERVRRALDAVPEPFRSALALVDVEELSYEEAAAATGCPVGTLRSRLFRGRRALAELLAPGRSGGEASLRWRSGRG